MNRKALFWSRSESEFKKALIATLHLKKEWTAHGKLGSTLGSGSL